MNIISSFKDFASNYRARLQTIDLENVWSPCMCYGQNSNSVKFEICPVKIEILISSRQN